MSLWDWLALPSVADLAARDPQDPSAMPPPAAPYAAPDAPSAPMRQSLAEALAGAGSAELLGAQAARSEVVPGGLVRGLIGLPGMGGDIEGLGRAAAGNLHLWPGTVDPRTYLPTSGDVIGAAERLPYVGPALASTEPRNTAEQYLSWPAEQLGGAVGAGAVSGLARIGGEAVRAAGRGVGDVLADVGGGGPGFARAAAPAAEEAGGLAGALAEPAAGSFVDQLRAAHLAQPDALPLEGARMPVTPPPHITTLDDLGGLVDRYVQDALAGRYGKPWYQQSGASILEHTGSPESATALAGALARTSPSTDVASNLAHAIAMNNQYMAGMPLAAGRFPTQMGADVAKVYYGGEPVTGTKIGPFMGAVAHQWSPDLFPHDFVNDIWNMRALEYPGAEGRLYEGKPSLGQHNFARIVAGRAQQRLEDITGEAWLPREVQAAAWTGVKSRLEGTTPEEAGLNFADAMARRYAQLSYEAAPGETTGHFPEYFSAPWELRQAYHNDIQAALTDPASGRDIIAAHIGLPTGRTFPGVGYFEGAVNPGAQVPVAVGSAPGGALKGIDEASRELMATSERVRGLLLNQDAVAASRPIYTGKIPVSQRSLYDVDVGRGLTPDETLAVAKAMQEETGSDFFAPIATPNGFRFRNVPEASGVPNGKFVAAADKMMGRPDILPGVETKGVSAASDGFYEANDWKVNPNGETYRSGLGAARSPDLQRRAAELLATLGPRVDAVNQAYAQRYGWTAGPQRRFWEEPAYQEFRLDQVPRPPRPGEVKPATDIPAGWKPLFGPGSILGGLAGLGLLGPNWKSPSQEGLF